MTYHLVTYTIAIQFKDIFAKHFNPHQFGVVTRDGCKIVVHGVLMMLNLHPNWMVLQVDVYNIFNSMSWSTIFQELKLNSPFLLLIFPICSIIICTPIHTVFFLGFPTCKSHSHFIQIKYTARDPLGKAVFVLVHLHIFEPKTTTHPIFFPFIGKWYTYNRSYINHGSYFLRLQEEFLASRLSM